MKITRIQKALILISLIFGVSAGAEPNCSINPVTAQSMGNSLKTLAFGDQVCGHTGYNAEQFEPAMNNWYDQVVGILGSNNPLPNMVKNSFTACLRKSCWSDTYNQLTYDTNCIGEAIGKDIALINENACKTLRPRPNVDNDTPVVTIEAGPIWNGDDAGGKCPAVCVANQRQWTGDWLTTIPNEMSVCYCKR